MPTITFYTKPGCHLCEDGQWMIEVAQQQRPLTVTYVNITDDPVLLDRYGNRIPVLHQPGRAAELDWPFTPEMILAWVDSSA